MNSLLPLSFVLGLVLFNPVYGQPCEYGENDCQLQQARVYYKTVVNGIDGLIEPSDPLYSDEIKGNIQCLTYRLTNVSLKGLKNCKVQKSLIKKTAETDTLCYEFTLFCPKLVIKYNFETNGTVEPVEIADKGNSTLTATDYVIIFTGKLLKFISKEDNKPHICRKPNSIETELKGKLMLESSPQNQTKAKTKETLEYLNRNTKRLEDFLECPVMAHFLEIFNERQDTYVRSVPADNAFPE